MVAQRASRLRDAGKVLIGTLSSPMASESHSAAIQLWGQVQRVNAIQGDCRVDVPPVSIKTG